MTYTSKLKTLLNDSADKELERLFGIPTQDYSTWKASANRRGTAGVLTMHKIRQAKNKLIYGHLSPEERKKAMKRDSSRRYRRSKNGLIRGCWHHMKQRISGKNTIRPQLYVGKELLSIQDFVDWAKGCPVLEQLYQAWKLNHYDIRLTPSVDRIDSNIGYKIGNIRWITHEENSRLGVKNRWRKNGN